jgi:glycerol-3-phosphate acyltransferase PlsY
MKLRTLKFKSYLTARCPAVTRWLSTAAARVRARVWLVGFVVDKVVLGHVFSEYFGFRCQISFHQILETHNHPG